MYPIIQTLERIFDYLNSNVIFNAVIILLMNLGGKHIAQEIPKSFDKLFENQWLRWLLIFCMVFIATRNIQVSIFLTIMFIIIMSALLNEKSKYCILPANIINLDKNEDGTISHDELIAAQQMLAEYLKKIHVGAP